jgi:hypothetical protein
LSGVLNTYFSFFKKGYLMTDSSNETAKPVATPPSTPQQTQGDAKTGATPQQNQGDAKPGSTTPQQK